MRIHGQTVVTEEGWGRLAGGAGLVAAAAALVTGVAVRDREAVAVGVLLMTGVGLLRLRDGGPGRVTLAVLFVNNEVWMLPAAASNVAHREGWRGVAVPLVLVAASATGLVAVVFRRLPPRWADRPGGPRVTALAAVAVLAVVLVGSRLPGVGRGAGVKSGDLIVGARNLEFSKASLSAPAGEVSVALRNHDLFWHTLTIDALAVDLRVPTGGVRRVTFTARPGVYEFYCATPGHKGVGMKGTLTVR
jgi:plastocyanin